MIVEWGLDQVPRVLGAVGIESPGLVTTQRFAGLDLPAPRRFLDVAPHVPTSTVEKAVEILSGSDGLLAVGGGSAIDTAKAVSARLNLPVVSVPTTYSGAEWTPTFGVLDEERHVKAGGSGARVEGIVYDVVLTLGLPRSVTGGTAMNALAHCAEALYVAGRSDLGDRHALEGARSIGESLPLVLAAPDDVEARTRLLRGAMHGGAALAAAGLGLAHAMAQALGGRFGMAHGAANAICLAPALRFNAPLVSLELESFGEALGTPEPIARVEELARLAGFERLRDLGVDRAGLPEAAENASTRAGARANPRHASPEEILELYEAVW